MKKSLFRHDEAIKSGHKEKPNCQASITFIWLGLHVNKNEEEIKQQSQKYISILRIVVNRAFDVNIHQQNIASAYRTITTAHFDSTISFQQIWVAPCNA